MHTRACIEKKKEKKGEKSDFNTATILGPGSVKEHSMVVKQKVYT